MRLPELNEKLPWLARLLRIVLLPIRIHPARLDFRLALEFLQPLDFFFPGFYPFLLFPNYPHQRLHQWRLLGIGDFRQLEMYIAHTLNIPLIHEKRTDRFFLADTAHGFSQHFSNAQLANFGAGLRFGPQGDGVGDNHFIQL